MQDIILMQNDPGEHGTLSSQRNSHLEHTTYISMAIKRVLAFSLVGLLLFLAALYLLITGHPSSTPVRPAVPHANLPQSFVHLDPITVNTVEIDHYIKAKIDLSVSSESDKITLEHNAFKIRDRIITLLSEKSMSDLRSMNGQGTLNKEIQADLNTFLGYQGVASVYFAEFGFQ